MPRPPQTKGEPAEFLSPWQLSLLFVTMLSSEGSSVLNRALNPIAGPDTWISVLLGSVAGLVMIFMMFRLARSFPNAGLSEIVCKLLGPFGLPVALAYAALFAFEAAFLSHAFAAASHSLLPNTPAFPIILPLIGVAVYAANLGMEVVGRVNAFILLMIDIPLGIVLSVLSKFQQSIQFLFPVMGAGPGPSLTGALMVTGTMSDFVLLLSFLPAVREPDRAKRAVLWGFLLAIVILLGHVVGPFLMFGRAAEDVSWPSFVEVQSIQVGRFVERVDILAVILWTHGFWLEVTMFLAGAARAVRGAFNLPAHRPFLVPIGLLVFIGAYYIVSGEGAELALRREVNEILWPFFGLVIPGVLLVANAIREARAKPPRRRVAGRLRV